MNTKRKVKKILWKIYIEETKSLDKILLEGKAGEEKLIKLNKWIR